jgi:hypothetical protein
VTRRKHKENEINDLRKALDFVEFEKTRRKQYLYERFYNEFLPNSYKFGFFVHCKDLSNQFLKWCEKNDELLFEVYNVLILPGIDNVDHIIRQEIIRLELTKAFLN